MWWILGIIFLIICCFCPILLLIGAGIGWLVCLGIASNEKSEITAKEKIRDSEIKDLQLMELRSSYAAKVESDKLRQMSTRHNRFRKIEEKIKADINPIKTPEQRMFIDTFEYIKLYPELETEITLLYRKYIGMYAVKPTWYPLHNIDIVKYIEENLK